MEWIRMSIETNNSQELINQLYNKGITGVELEDPEDYDQLLNSGGWDYMDQELEQKLKERSENNTCRVIIYVTNNLNGMETINNLNLKNMAHMVKSVGETIIKEEDWENNWKQYFKPIEVGEKILIVPEWIDGVSSQRTIFRINPGMSFGTGSHATTQLCIEALERFVKKGDDVLDIGTGSGILSIISLLLGANSATGVDVDPNCVRIAYENARLNEIEVSYENNGFKGIVYNLLTEPVSGLTSEKFDVVVANIVSDVIIGLKDAIPQLVKENGVFLASGIIEERLEEVIAQFDGCFNNRQIVKKDGWVLLAYCLS